MSHPPVPSSLVPGLYIVATPIGNAEDITLRALQLLQEADVIACEDTRVTDRLLNRHGIRKSMICYNDFSTEKNRQYIVDRIRKGERIALVSDAGTPLISDPGYKLVLAVQESGYPVQTLPGPSSVIAALTVAGLPTHRFLFEGFLPPREAARKTVLEQLTALDATLVFFESPRRVQESLEAMHQLWGNREAAVIRELTKPYEEVKRGALGVLLSHYRERGEPRGEVVIVVGPPVAVQEDADSIKSQLRVMLGSLHVKEAVALLAEQVHMSKKQIYQYALEIMKEQEE